MHPCSVSVMSYYIIRAHTPVCHPVCYCIYVYARLLIGTDRASLLGVKFGYQSNDKPCRRWRWCKCGISWYIYMMYGRVVWVNNKASYVWDGMGGTKYNASTQMKNNAKAIMETPCKGVPICRKTEH